jgi:hypothetical protein
MKKLILLMLIATPLFAQMDTDSTRSIVPRTAHYGWLGTNAKPWRTAHLDSIIALYKPVINGVMMGSGAFTDSASLKAALLKNADSTTIKASLVAKADSSTMPGYVTRQMISTDSTNRNVLLAAKQSILWGRNVTLPTSGTLTPNTTTDTVQSNYFKVITKLIPPTSGQVGFWTRNTLPQSGTISAATSTDTIKNNYFNVGTKLIPPSSGQVGFWTRNTLPASGTIVPATSTDTIKALYFNRGALYDSVALKKDFSRISIAISMDSSYINTTDTVWVCLPDYVIVLDSIGVFGQNGVAQSVVYKFLYSTNALSGWTAIITAPATITTVTTKVWQSSLNNATLPANGILGILCSTVTTKPKQAMIHFVGKRQQNNINY